MIFQKEISIDGESYVIHKLTATKSLNLMTKLTKIIGKPIMGLAMNGGMSIDIESEKGAALIGEAVDGLFGRLDEAFVLQTVKEILESVYVDGNSPVVRVFDTHFQGRMKHLFTVLYEALKVQYEDFFDGLAGVKAKLAAGKK